MRIKDLGIPEGIITYLNDMGMDKLYPPQEMAIKAGVMEGKSVLVSAPTASGKSLVALLAYLSMLKNGGRRAVYLSPLKALASEKYREFKDIQGVQTQIPIKPSISVRDINVRDRLQGNIICMTNERMDIALRRDERWLDRIDLVIADEIHLVQDPTRGPVLEMILTLLNQKRQILGLSATMSNAEEIAQWLDCTLVKSQWRPVKLTEGVYSNGTIQWADNKKSHITTSSRGPAADLALDSIKHGHQSLIFVNMRRSAPAIATRASDAVQKTLNGTEKAMLDKVSDTILRGNENTQLVVKLATLIKSGVAFHNAGLNSTCRDTVEKHFRAGHIKVLTATPTLAAGVNLPAHRVIISNITRYDINHGRNMPISVMEYKQCCGRAGRPQYDDAGQAVVVATENPDDILDVYIHGEPEPIRSRISGQLDIHLLSLIVSRPGITVQQMNEFFDSTLGGMHEGITIDYDLEDLVQLDMVQTVDNNRYAATKLGDITSKLYIKPETSKSFLQTVKQAKKRKKNTLGFLYAMSQSDEFFPKKSLLKRQEDMAYEFLQTRTGEMIDDIYTDDISRELLGLYGWINEETEKDIAEKYMVESGDTRRAIETSRWLLYCMIQLATYTKLPDIRRELEALRIRVANGVKEELVPLVTVRNIGRVRGRALYKAGIRSVRDIKNMPISRIEKICNVGIKTAKSIQVSANV